MAMGMSRPPRRGRHRRREVVRAARAAEHDVADVLHHLDERVEECDLLRPSGRMPIG